MQKDFDIALIIMKCTENAAGKWQNSFNATQVLERFSILSLIHTLAFVKVLTTSLDGAHLTTSGLS